MTVSVSLRNSKKLDVMVFYNRRFIDNRYCGFLAALLVPLPLITYGAFAALGGLLLITYKQPKDSS